MLFLVFFIFIPIIVAATNPINIKTTLSEENNSPRIGKYLILYTFANSDLSISRIFDFLYKIKKYFLNHLPLSFRRFL